MKITYRVNDYGFRVKKDGNNYWLGFTNKDKSDIDEIRIYKRLYDEIIKEWKK